MYFFLRHDASEIAYIYLFLMSFSGSLVGEVVLSFYTVLRRIHCHESMNPQRLLGYQPFLSSVSMIFVVCPTLACRCCKYSYDDRRSYAQVFPDNFVCLCCALFYQLDKVVVADAS